MKAGRQQVAVDFSRSRTTRTDFAKVCTLPLPWRSRVAPGSRCLLSLTTHHQSEVPGPGEYEVTKTPVFGPGAGKKSGARASANFASRVSRSGPVRRRRHRTPGPGSYQVPGAFKNQVHRSLAPSAPWQSYSCLTHAVLCCVELHQYVPERQQFFGSTTRRFQAPRSHSGTAHRLPTPRMCHVPSPRFPIRCIAATVPGPGAYDTSANDRGGRSGVRSATARSRKAVTSHVGFTSTSARFGVAKPSRCVWCVEIIASRSGTGAHCVHATRCPCAAKSQLLVPAPTKHPPLLLTCRSDRCVWRAWCLVPYTADFGAHPACALAVHRLHEMASLVAHRSASSNQGTQRCQVREHMMQRYSFKLHVHCAEPTRLPAQLSLLLPQVKPSKRTADLAKKPLSVFASRNDVRASP